MSINRSQANANTIKSLIALQSAADAVFIASVSSQIATADALGRNEITATTNKMMNLVNVYVYYIGLGYTVHFPDYANQHAGVWPGLYNQPADLFGWLWVEYWSNEIDLYGVKNPCRLTIQWARGAPPPQPEGSS